MKTPQQSYPELAKALGISELYLKREDLHTYGSHKGRSIPLMIKLHTKAGKNSFAISSSGNAALAAILTVQNHNRNNPANQITLRIFIGTHIDEEKKKRLEAEITDRAAITIEQVERPKQSVFQLDKEGRVTSLRQSTDDTALQGYAELAGELDKIEHVQAIFVPTSSGTTAQGLAEAFQHLQHTPQIHIVQTTACHPIAQEFDKHFTETETSLAGAIVDTVAHRKTKLIELIKTTHGSGWVISDEEIKTVVHLVKKHANLSISYNSALSVAGIKKAIDSGWTWNGPVVALICGR